MEQGLHGGISRHPRVFIIGLHVAWAAYIEALTLGNYRLSIRNRTTYHNTLSDTFSFICHPLMNWMISFSEQCRFIHRITVTRHNLYLIERISHVRPSLNTQLPYKPSDGHIVKNSLRHKIILTLFNSSPLWWVDYKLTHRGGVSAFGRDHLL